MTAMMAFLEHDGPGNKMQGKLCSGVRVCKNREDETGDVSG